MDIHRLYTFMLIFPFYSHHFSLFLLKAFLSCLLAKMLLFIIRLISAVEDSIATTYKKTVRDGNLAMMSPDKSDH